MESRFSLPELNADLYRRMTALQSAVENCGLDHQLLELIKMRASQINGCAYCLDIHSKAARAAGEKEVGQIIWAAAVINTWNRLAIAARSVPGS